MSSNTKAVKLHTMRGLISKQWRILLAVTLLLATYNTHAQMTLEIVTLQHDWAIANYQLTGKEQDSAYKKLLDRVDLLVERKPQSAEAWAWSGIVKSTYAGIAGGLGALKYAKAAKNDLEKSLQINERAMEGSAYASLGILYLKLPGWPISFGSDKKAKKLLKQALAINPEGIDNNFFYAEYLRDANKFEKAERYLTKAANVPASPQRPIADTERQKEIAIALQEVRKKL